eukprot:TRINITY_DN3274_c2_g1_i10.p3 TRINITY_DN3274_c2_g1~~TRINITY_DN3274_c2_g1_i10.p3  ORF type:complete len:128 (-),score=28.54 TRINITY_DN3274_c2_g1_i10:384-767(-)
MFAACGSGDPKTIQLTKNSIQNYSRKGNDLQAKLTVNVGLNLTDGVVAYWDGKYDEAVELMEAVRYDVRPIGGSNAQRDVFSQLLIKSAIESKNYKNLAAALINERRALKPQQSPLTERFQSRLDNL